jgi:pyruvate dehydrogenase E1 component alpha subunit
MAKTERAGGHADVEVGDDRVGRGHEDLVDLYRQMVLVRMFEQSCQRSFRKGAIGGYMHLYTGQEAVAAGFLAQVRDGDKVITGYRDHAHALLLRCDPRRVMAELYGRRAGLSKGKGGSMHLFAVDRGLCGGYGIVGGHIALGVGFAYALRYQGTDHICQLYVGDGALETGAFHEAANLAGLWGRDGNCPVVFVVENNQYAMGTSVERSTAMTDLASKFDAYGIEREKIDGMDLEAVIECAARATEQVRESGKPYAVEAVTYRLAPHGAADFAKYRTEEEVAQWRERDPIETLERKLLEAGALDAGMIDEIKSGVRDEVEKAIEFAAASEPPPEEELYADVLAGGDDDDMGHQ